MPQSNTISNGKSTINKPKFSVYDIAIVGVMAAIIFALTYFVKIPIPTPAGQTMLKVANAFCLLAGILFGGL
ncbi:MAG: ECF transporter S component, partial [Oscillospiraceae bacterium]